MSIFSSCTRVTSIGATWALCVMCLFLHGPASISYHGLPNRLEGNDGKTSSRELRTFLENFFRLFFKSVKCQGEREREIWDGSWEGKCFQDGVMSQGAANRICKCNLSPSYCPHLSCKYVLAGNCLSCSLWSSLTQQILLVPLF